MSPGKKPVLLTTQQAADAIGVGAEQVRRYIKAGKLASEKVGRVYGVRPSEVERFKQGPSPQRGRPKKM